MIDPAKKVNNHLLYLSTMIDINVKILLQWPQPSTECMIVLKALCFTSIAKKIKGDPFIKNHPFLTALISQ